MQLVIVYIYMYKRFRLIKNSKFECSCVCPLRLQNREGMSEINRQSKGTFSKTSFFDVSFLLYDPIAKLSFRVDSKILTKTIPSLFGISRLLTFKIDSPTSQTIDFSPLRSTLVDAAHPSIFCSFWEPALFETAVFSQLDFVMFFIAGWKPTRTEWISSFYNKLLCSAESSAVNGTERFGSSVRSRLLTFKYKQNYFLDRLQ